MFLHFIHPANIIQESLSYSLNTTIQVILFSTINWGILLSIISILISLLGIINRKKISLAYNRLLRKSQIAEELPNAFHDHNPNKIYIQPKFSYISNEKNGEFLFQDHFLNKVLIKHTKEPSHYLLFGDTGTGKTAALVQLFADYIRRHPFKDNITILSLSSDNVLTEIQKIEKTKRNKHILLLDALDENPMAQDPNELTSFSQKLNILCSEFAFVIITCRPQLFSNEETASTTFQAHIGEHWNKYTFLQLSNFNGYQVDKYLFKIFSSDAEKAKYLIKAKEIVNKNAFIVIRPLVLTYIKDIIATNREINTTLDLYDIIIENTLRRDLEKFHPSPSKQLIQQWWNMTSDVAGYMYQHHIFTITEEDIQKIPSVQNVPLFSQRSMLTLSSKEYHFSHKSFYEYFIAYRFFLHPKEIKYIAMMDFAIKLYDELYDSYKANKEVLFMKFNCLNPGDIALSLLNVSFYSFYYKLIFDQPGCNPYIIDYESKYKDGISLLRKLTNEEPNSYMKTLAIQLEEFAFYCHEHDGHYKEAYYEYKEALKYYRILALQNPTNNLFAVRNTLTGLFRTCFILNTNTDDVRNEYNETLKIFKKITHQDPDSCLPEIAEILYETSLLFLRIKDIHAAESAALESLEKYRILAEKSHAEFDPKVKKAEELLERIRKAKEADA